MKQALVLLAAGAAIFAPAATSQENQGPRIVSELETDTPSIEITARLGRVDAAGRATVTFVVTARESVPDAVLDIVSAGDAELIAPSGYTSMAPGQAYHAGMNHNARIRRDIGRLRAGTTLTFSVRVTIREGGRGFVAAAVHSPSNPDADESLNVYIARLADRLITSTSSMLDVEAAVLRATAGSAGAVALQEQLEALLESGARSSTTVSRAGPRATNVGEITVAGRLLFTDRLGATHPVKAATVRVYDRDPSSETKLAEITTDDDGRFRATMPNADGDGTGQDVFIRAWAEGPNVRVRQWGANIVRAIRSEGVTSDVADGAMVQIELTATNSQANNLAFEIHQSIEQMARFVNVQNGPRIPQLTVLYPRAGDSSSYNGTMLLADTDAHDWDNIQHEYGHHVQRHAQIGNNPGGKHGSGQDLCRRYANKSFGRRLAYGETWPTVFGLISQNEQDLGSLGIPNLGDTSYTDVKGDGDPSGYDLEVGAAAAGGEGRELTMMRTMWDLYDSAPEGGEAVAMGVTPLWAASIEGGRAPFSAFWNALIRPLPESERFRLGGVMASQWLAAGATAPGDGVTYSGGTAPTFRWDAASACRTTIGLRYSLLVLDQVTGQVRWRSPWQSGRTFTPNATQVRTIFGGADGPLTWGVLTRDQNTPATGDYYGPGRTIVDAYTP